MVSKLFKSVADVACETHGSAGFDIKASKGAVILPGETKLVHTDLYLGGGMPDGFFLAIHSRSGLALKKSVFVLNAPGVVDSDYPGEIGIILHNGGSEPFEVNKGDRVAQGIIMRHYTHDFVPTKDAVRGGGFGSTGV